MKSFVSILTSLLILLTGGSLIAADTLVSEKAASAERSAPTPLNIGEVVKARLGPSGDTGKYHYWLVNLPAGKYKIAVDARLADESESNIGGELDWFSTDGEKMGTAGRMNLIGDRRRWVFGFSLPRPQRALLRYANTWSIVDYWLAVYKDGEPIPSPFFVKQPAVQPLTLGQPSPSATIDPANPVQRAAYASMRLTAGDYKVSVTFTRNDRKSGNVGGSVAALDADGNTQLDHLVGVNQVDVTAKGVSKLSLADDTAVIFRTSSSFGQVQTVLLVERWPD
jgi:hypothetical protein